MLGLLLYFFTSWERSRLQGKYDTSQLVLAKHFVDGEHEQDLDTSGPEWSIVPRSHAFCSPRRSFPQLLPVPSSAEQNQENSQLILNCAIAYV